MQESATHVQCVFKCWFQWAMPLTKHQPMITSSTFANTIVTLVALAQIIFFYKCKKISKDIFLFEILCVKEDEESFRIF